jgi:hypothetical protein
MENNNNIPEYSPWDSDSPPDIKRTFGQRCMLLSGSWLKKEPKHALRTRRNDRNLTAEMSEEEIVARFAFLYEKHRVTDAESHVRQALAVIANWMYHLATHSPTSIQYDMAMYHIEGIRVHRLHGMGHHFLAEELRNIVMWLKNLDARQQHYYEMRARRRAQPPARQPRPLPGPAPPLLLPPERSDVAPTPRPRLVIGGGSRFKANNAFPLRRDLSELFAPVLCIIMDDDYRTKIERWPAAAALRAGAGAGTGVARRRRTRRTRRSKNRH